MVKTENTQQLSRVLSFETSAGRDISQYICKADVIHRLKVFLTTTLMTADTRITKRLFSILTISRGRF